MENEKEMNSNNVERNYFIHRISHEWKVSYPLLHKGYLSIGWSMYMKTDLFDQIEKNGESAFNKFMSKDNNYKRNRWSLWRFSQFKKGDYIVVPLFDKMFSVYEVTGKPTSILTLKGLSLELYDGSQANVTEDGLKGTDGHLYDIGYVIPVTQIKIDTPRSYADKYLISRMKIQQTNAYINDLSDSVLEVINATGPINIHEKMMESVSENLKGTIKKYITPDDLEDAVCWYMMKKGADIAWKPAKNEPDKEHGADADVIAEFDDLGLVYYVQVKDHDGETGVWAVSQINEYYKQKQEKNDGTTYIPWVVSMAEKFSSKAIDLAKDNNIRLINGDEFIKMLLNVGIDGIEDAVKKKK